MATKKKKGGMQVREIEFRGQSENGEWVEGSLLLKRDGDRLLSVQILTGEQSIPVLPETVGQYTGVRDIHNRKIYEQDIIKDRFGMTFVVIMDDEENRFMGVGFADELWGERQGDVRFIRPYSVKEHELEVVGDKHQHKEYQDTLKYYLESGE